MKTIFKYYLGLISTAFILANSVFIGIPSSKHILFYMLSGELFSRDQSSRYEIYRISKILPIEGLNQYIALQIFKNTEEKNIENFSSEIWKDIPDIKLRVLPALNGGLSRVYNEVNNFLGFTNVYRSELVKRQGNIGYLIDATSSPIIVNLINSVKIGAPDEKHAFEPWKSTNSILGVQMCALTTPPSVKENKKKQFAFFNVLSGKRQDTSYPSYENCISDLMKIFRPSENAIPEENNQDGILVSSEKTEEQK